MPELPEVETTRRGIEPHILDRAVAKVIVRQPKLRWPVPRDLESKLPGLTVHGVERRAKYLFLRTDGGTVIIHLGMSGSLRIVESGQAPQKHDHVDICFDNDRCLRLTDPRRFGAVLWTKDDPAQHELIAPLGPEPLSAGLTGEHLFDASRGKKTSIKQFIMDGRIVVGVGNIYANEALFRAGIHPKQTAGKISAHRFERLVQQIKAVLGEAIAQGGTTLRDFVGGDGKPGYFAQHLDVYGRAGESCHACGGLIKQIILGQRSTFYCPRCQR